MILGNCIRCGEPVYADCSPDASFWDTGRFYTFGDSFWDKDVLLHHFCALFFRSEGNPEQEESGYGA